MKAIHSDKLKEILRTMGLQKAIKLKILKITHIDGKTPVKRFLYDHDSL